MIESNIVLYINSVVAIGCIWIIMYINFKCLYESSLNSKRFKLFELRDRLTVMVMKGDLDIDSSEYSIMLYSLNYYINATENFKLLVFLKRLWNYEQNSALKEKTDNLVKNINEHSLELKKIFMEFNNTMDQLFGKRIIVSCFILLLLLFIPLMIVESRDYALSLWDRLRYLLIRKREWKTRLAF